ncbi:MAG: alanine racemase [Bacteroidetes bacterium]|jgi:alanine racemase|nr:alanine racemase [Bacteroidota bacterium]
MQPTFLKPSSIVLDRSSLQSNIQFLKSLTEGRVKISSVIKGNAYGHGIESFLPLAEDCGIDHFSVFSADEAVKARKAKTRSGTELMIMGMIRDDELEWAVEKGVEFYLFENERLHAAVRAAEKLGKRARVHLQLETGMHRTGFEEKNWEKVFTGIQKQSALIELKGICTHFAGAESVANYYRVNEQNERFKKAMRMADRIFGKKPLSHASSSAAYLSHREKRYDMARIGIAQYGFWPSRETYMQVVKTLGFEQGVDPLKRVMTWKSEVMNIKEVDEGDYIGYGNVFLSGKKMRIATVPIGYTHGFGRNLTNTGYVLVNGTRAGVVGLVNMNMITINVSHIENVKKGDEVVLIGRQKDDEITVASFGEMTNNLNYEVLTRLPVSIPRIVSN